MDNRRALERLVHGRLEHFCYPSGVYHPRGWPWLEELGLQRATTTGVRFCHPDTHPYALPRTLDGENVPQVEFEAEMAGALELVRRLRRWVSGERDARV